MQTENFTPVLIQSQLNSKFRQIRSFVRREGRITKTQSEALETLWPVYGLPFLGGEGSDRAEDPIDFGILFGRNAEIVLEIGFGDGNSLLQMAKAAPHKDFIGIEVYRTGVGNLLAGLNLEKISNVRVFCADALEVLASKIPDSSLDTVQAFFADPWPKKRHHKRRLVQSSFISLVSRKLKSEGTLHLATDWEAYAHHMMCVLSASEEFQNLAGKQNFIPRPDFRPLTKYEQRGHRLGHSTWDLLFRNNRL